MRIIPAIDIIEGRCVRLTRGDYSTAKTYSEDPLEVAKELENWGIRFLHLVDLDGARSGGVKNFGVLEKLASQTRLTIDFGGGIKTSEDAGRAFECGAAQINVGSLAVKNKALFLEWLNTFGPDKIILSADAENRKISVAGWLECTETNVIDFITGYEKEGVKYVTCTDISKDGTLQGPATDLYREILEKSSVNLIAGGGIASVDDLHKLKLAGCEGAIIGKAIYEGFITLKELSTLC